MTTLQSLGWQTVEVTCLANTSQVFKWTSLIT